MPNSIAFFPWVSLREPLTAGPVRLTPYTRGRLPGDGPDLSQADLDGVLGAYAVRKDHPVEEATLLELGDWRLGQDTGGISTDLFRARELIAFSALAERRIFRGHFNYCNFDTYALVVQNYHPGNPGTFSFTTRRRDGGAQHLWNADEFAFLKPLHVDYNTRLHVDAPLVAALFEADDADLLSYDAIVEFNHANTDSMDVPIHTEFVMTKSAFEYFLNIDQNVDEFVHALRGVIPERGAALEGPLRDRWSAARPRATRPLEAWAREFCDLRGGAAHGRPRGGDRFVWSSHAHLAFASILFPLLVKQRLARNGRFQMAERDIIELEWIESYLMHDPFEVREPRQQHREHPWSRVYSDEVLGKVLRKQLERRMAEIDQQNIPQGNAE